VGPGLEDLHWVRRVEMGEYYEELSATISVLEGARRGKRTYTRIYNRRMYERRQANEEYVSKKNGYRW
jgi:hypothetical protein